jgi:tetratricopeptide (TPR) repeat protein
MRHLAIVLALVLAVVSVPTAHAGGIVLEAYTGQRPANATTMIAPLLAELANRGFLGGYGVVGSKYENDVSRPSILDQGLPIDFADRINRGYKDWASGKFDDAIALLNPIIALAHANAGAFADAPQAQRDLVFKGLIGLALAQQRQGDPSAARSTLDELIRSFPTATMTKGFYGADAAQAFDTAKREAAASHAKLTVKVLDQSAQVFIDERNEHTGTTTKTDLPAGEYRVFIRIGGRLSRTHLVTLRASGDATITIDLDLDLAIQTSTAWTGLRFATAAQRETSEAPYASQFAHDINASAVAVVGLDQVKGHLSIIGALVNLATGREIRRAIVSADPPPPDDKVRALGRFLAGDEPVSGIEVLDTGSAATPPPTTAATTPTTTTTTTTQEPEHVDRPERKASGGGNPLKWIAGAAAVGAITTGIVFFAYDGKCATVPPSGQQCPKLNNDTAPAIGFTAGGVALAVLSVYLFTHSGSDAPSKTAFLTPTSGGAIAGFMTRF